MSNESPPFAQAATLANTVGQIGCVTSLVSLVIIAAAFFGGRFLDEWLGTGGVLTVLFMLGSFPITLFAIVRISILLMSRAQPAAPAKPAPRDRAQAPDEQEEENQE